MSEPLRFWRGLQGWSDLVNPGAPGKRKRYTSRTFGRPAPSEGRCASLRRVIALRIKPASTGMER